MILAPYIAAYAVPLPTYLLFLYKLLDWLKVNIRVTNNQVLQRMSIFEQINDVRNVPYT